jgi:integrase
MAYVFGDVTGGRVKDRKKAWTLMRLKAAGFTGRVRDGKTRRMTPEARAALKDLNLHWHDLRREAGSSFADDKLDVRAIQTFMDHANLSQTQTYLKLSQKALHEEVARMEARRAERQKLVGIGIAGGDPGEARSEPTTGGDRKLKAV